MPLETKVLDILMTALLAVETTTLVDKTLSYGVHRHHENSQKTTWLTKIRTLITPWFIFLFFVFGIVVFTLSVSMSLQFIYSQLFVVKPYVFVDSDQRHVMPSVLSIKENNNGTYKFINALSNHLYEHLKIATFHLQEVNNRSKTFNESDDYIQLHTDKTNIHFHDSLLVSWNESWTWNPHDVIALYCPATEDDPTKFIDAATMEHIQATMESSQGIMIPTNQWVIDSFPVIKQNSCEFRLYQRESDPQKPVFTHVGSSGPITIVHGELQPTLIHLALTSRSDEMLVHFSTGTSGRSIVIYSTDWNVTQTPSLTAIPRQFSLQLGNSTTYKASDLCAPPANMEEPGKFMDPNMLHTVIMTDLQLDTTYYYKVGILSSRDDPILDSSSLENVVWSKIITFQSPLPAGYTTTYRKNKQAPMTIIVYADQGIQGYGNHDNADRVALFTEREVENHTISSIHHFGDLAYAQGSGHAWDAWLDMIEPFAAKVPLMIGIGNHEYDYTSGGGRNRKDPSRLRTNGYHPRWGNFGTDSNGECGVPTAKRFQMPSSPDSNGVFWYSFDQGLLHTIMLSSEHDLTPLSTQYKWLERDLASIDRNLTPWVIVEVHRPMYNIEDVPANTLVGIHMRSSIESLLQRHNVDLLLSGHYHAYFRSCSGLFQGKCNNGGLTHITVGTAGAELDLYKLLNETWVEFYKSEWGYGRITIVDAIRLIWEFVSDDDGSVHDRLVLDKPTTGNFRF